MMTMFWEHWIKMNQAIEAIKGCKTAMRLKTIKYAVRQLEEVLAANSDDDGSKGNTDDD